MKKEMAIEWLEPEKLRAYENNPRRNEKAVEPVARSIHEFGFRNPILIDASGTIISGHTRLEAAKQLGLEKVPVIRIEDLSEDQVRAFRLVDNKVAEIAEWDPWALSLELETIDMDLSAFDFDLDDLEAPDPAENLTGGASWFESRKRYDSGYEEGNDEYNAFLAKFEQPKTTDDCYTPDNVYEAVASWVSKEYGIRREDMVRPFYPGGDYEHEAYPAGCCVVDNPPFSILSQIVDFYVAKGIDFFIFAPGLSCISAARKDGVCYIGVSGSVLYENKAEIRTAFLTSLEGDKLCRAAFDLSDSIQEANEENKQKISTQLPKYSYPDNVLTAAMVQYLAAHHTDLTVKRSDAYFIRALDAQRELGSSIYGSGFLLSTSAAAEKAAAEKAAAEKAVVEKAAAEKAAAEKAAAHRWLLSDRERAIIAALDAGEVPANE